MASCIRTKHKSIEACESVGNVSGSPIQIFYTAIGEAMNVERAHRTSKSHRYMAVVGVRVEQQTLDDSQFHPNGYDRSLLPNFFSDFETVERGCQAMDLNPLQEEVY